MNENEHTSPWEQALAKVARAYQYPPTPDLAVSIRQQASAAPRPTFARRRTPSWAVVLAVMLAVMALGALVVPQSRAAVLAFVARIGAIRVFVDDTVPVATASPIPAVDPPQMATPTTATPVPLALLAAVPGEPIVLESLADAAPFRVLMPVDDDGWGRPDSAVMHQLAGHVMVSLIWERAGQPVLTLTQTDVPQLAFKMAGSQQVEAVMIGSLDGLWITGPHTLQLPVDGGPDQVQIASNVLLWNEGAMTYRLEGHIARDDAIQLAESLTRLTP